MSAHRKPIEWTSGRVKTPSMLQMEATECGAASLGIVLGYYGRYVELEKLREDCDVTRDGSKASNVIKAASAYGLTAKGYRKIMPQLSTLTLPMVILWNYNHFLVLEGTSGGKYYLNDPQSGSRRVTAGEFAASYSNIAISFEPNENFVTGGTRKTMVGTYMDRLRPFMGPFAVAIFTALLMVVANFLTANFNHIFVDNIITEMKLDWRKPVLWSMGGISVFYGLLLAANGLIQSRMQIAMSISSSAQFLIHLLRLPMSFFSVRYSGELASRVGMNDAISSVVSRDVVSTLSGVVSMAFFIVLIALYDPLIAAIAVGSAAINWGLMAYVTTKRADLSERVIMDRSSLVGMSLNGLMMIETLKASGLEHNFLSQVTANITKSRSSQFQFDLIGVCVTPVTSALSAITSAAVLCFGGLRVIGGVLTYGMLIGLQTLVGNFSSPVMEIASKLTSFRMTFGMIKRVDDVLAAPTSSPWDVEVSVKRGYLDAAVAPYAAAAKYPAKLPGTLEIRGLTFGYSRLKDPLIDNFSITLGVGERVAFVGRSGSGKSTLSMLITGLLKPWSGSVLIGGHAMEAIPRHLFARSVSFVNQNITLYEGSVLDNITMWKDYVTFDDVKQACRDAACFDDIMARPLGFDTLVEEGGRNFSGGQCQRFDIARAIATCPSVMVLDEATSALDTITELHVNNAIKARGATCVMVAHRLSAIRDCDRIVVLENGKVIEQGTHAELLSEGSHYLKLIEN